MGRGCASPFLAAGRRIGLRLARPSARSAFGLLGLRLARPSARSAFGSLGLWLARSWARSAYSALRPVGPSASRPFPSASQPFGQLALRSTCRSPHLRTGPTPRPPLRPPGARPGLLSGQSARLFLSPPLSPDPLPLDAPLFLPWWRPFEASCWFRGRSRRRRDQNTVRSREKATVARRGEARRGEAGRFARGSPPSPAFGARSIGRHRRSAILPLNTTHNPTKVR